ncbi:MAG: hypothetical protein QOE40_3417, partial [Actinomycetota bacterium]|nr:hypothetical protein [Actinomycetota bacterium]
MRPTTKILLPKLALPAALTLAAAMLVSIPVQSQLVDVGQQPPGSADAGPIDGGGPVELVLPLPMREPHETQSPVPAAAAAAAAAAGVTAVPAVQVFGSGGSRGDIPANVLRAYQAAAASINASDPSCNLPWTVLAGIGKVESGHARGGSLDASGRTTSPILGPQLSGGPNIAAIRDTDNGQYDGDTAWDRAVGPMQFIPSSWSGHAVDGNADGKKDPSNIYDATLASAGYLCTGDRDLSISADLRQAVYGYNHSWDYVSTVLAWANAYDGGAVAVAPTVVTGGVAARSTSTKPAGSATGKGDPTPAPRQPRPTGQPTGNPTSPLAAEAAATPAAGSPTPSPSAQGSSPADSAPAASSSTSAVDNGSADPTTPGATEPVSPPPPSSTTPPPHTTPPPPADPPPTPAAGPPPPPPADPPPADPPPADPPPADPPPADPP